MQQLKNEFFQKACIKSLKIAECFRMGKVVSFDDPKDSCLFVVDHLEGETQKQWKKRTHKIADDLMTASDRIKIWRDPRNSPHNGGRIVVTRGYFHLTLFDKVTRIVKDLGSTNFDQSWNDSRAP